MKDFSPLDITSPAIGFPARIGVITRTDGTVIRFAESDEPLIVEGDTYAVVPGLKVSAISHTSNGEMPSCQFMGVQGATFSSVDLDVGLFDAATVQIYIVDRLNLTRKGLAFTGAVSNINCDPMGRGVVFDVKGPASSARKLMTMKRAPMCRTDLFSSLCQVDKTAYAVATTVDTIVDAFNFTVTGALAEVDGWFNQGVVVTSTGVAFVTSNWSQSSQTITAYLPCSRLISVGLGLTLYPGCDKTLTGTNGCAKFANQINFQGEPHFTGTAAAAQQI